MIDWCGLTRDLRGRAVADAAAVDQVLLVEFALTPEEIVAKVEDNSLAQSDSVTQWLLIEPGACSAAMSRFEVIGNLFDPGAYMVENPERTWLISVTNLPDNRLDILMSTFVEPLDSSDATTVEITDDSAALSFQADLHSADPLPVKVGETPRIDWSSVTTDVNGAPYDPLLGNRLLLGKIPVETLEEVEESFLRLDEMASELYYLDVYGKTVGDLSKAKTRGGQVFQGFTTDGIWLVGVECLSCTSPAPLLLAVAEVSE